jgi:hypothetical protein
MTDRLKAIGPIADLRADHHVLLGSLEPDEVAARWFDGAILVAYYLDDGDIVVAPQNYNLHPGDEIVAESWSTVAFSLGPECQLHFVGGLRRSEGPPPGASDPNYDLGY